MLFNLLPFLLGIPVALAIQSAYYYFYRDIPRRYTQYLIIALLFPYPVLFAQYLAAHWDSILMCNSESTIGSNCTSFKAAFFRFHDVIFTSGGALSFWVAYGLLCYICFVLMVNSQSEKLRRKVLWGILFFHLAVTIFILISGKIKDVQF